MVQEAGRQICLCFVTFSSSASYRHPWTPILHGMMGIVDKDHAFYFMHHQNSLKNVSSNVHHLFTIFNFYCLSALGHAVFTRKISYG